MTMQYDGAVARIQRVLDACIRVEEVTLAGNGVNASEAAQTLRWVFRGEETQEYWYEDDDG